MFIYNFLVEYAYLIIGLVVYQFAQCMFHISISIDISLNGINDTIIGNATFNDIIILPWLFAGSTINDEVKPLFIVSVKDLDFIVFGWNELIAIDDSLFGVSYRFDTNRPFGSLFI